MPGFSAWPLGVSTLPGCVVKASRVAGPAETVTPVLTAGVSAPSVAVSV